MLEICVDSIESVENARKGGADRLELCSALALGGLTPTTGFLEIVKGNVSMPVFCMIRPRAGDFNYSEQEIRIMHKDIGNLKKCGADGFVFGVLNNDGRVNKEACRYLLAEAFPLPATFHRAFDLCVNWRLSLEEIVECGFNRLLTSGQAAGASLGQKTLEEIFVQANDRITVIAGCGVNETNIENIHRSTGITEFHSSASVVKLITPTRDVKMGKAENFSNMVSSDEKIRSMKSIIKDMRT